MPVPVIRKGLVSACTRIRARVRQTVVMFRRIAAIASALFAIALLAGACTATTVIGEGRLGEPTETAATTERGDRVAPADDTSAASGEAESAAEAGGAVDEEEAEAFASLGDDELIEAWSAECRGGSDLACDVLFTITDRDSEAEALARTCGGRSDVEVRFCTPDIDPFEDRVWFDADSPGLPDVVDDCETGDLISCDFLYFRSEVGSSYEEIGNSCGGRVAIAIPDCRTALGGINP